MRALDDVTTWPVRSAAVAVVGRDGTLLGTVGDVRRGFPLASVTKPLVAYAVLVAVEEGALDLDDPAGPDGSTVRHLLAHASGLPPGDGPVAAAPGTRRIYTNRGFDVLGATVQSATGIPFADYLRDAVCGPLGMSATALRGSPAFGAVSTVDDLVRFAAELQSPRLLDKTTVEEMATVQFPGLSGVLPGYGRQEHNDWGLGVEIRNGKSPHWTAGTGSPRTYGHFGRSGTFVWVDPDAGVACVCLTDREFGDWAIKAWPALAEDVLAGSASSDRPS